VASHDGSGRVRWPSCCDGIGKLFDCHGLVPEFAESEPHRAVNFGQVACTRTVGSDKAVHSLHSYFLLPADAEKPIIFTVCNCCIPTPCHPVATSRRTARFLQVSRLRDGRSFATRSCVATQGGQTIFCCMVSFHRIDEPSQYSHQEPMPPAPSPESLPDQAERVRRMLADPRIPESFKVVLAKELTKQGRRLCLVWLHWL
jgi:acyl-CoA thioesterase